MTKGSSCPHPLHKLDPQDRPQERLEKLGPAPLTDRELLAMLIRSGTARRDVLTLADDLVRQAGSLTGLLRWTTDFERIRGLAKYALQLSTFVEIAKRMIEEEQGLIFGAPAVVWGIFTRKYAPIYERVWAVPRSENKLIRADGNLEYRYGQPCPPKRSLPTRNSTRSHRRHFGTIIRVRSFSEFGRPAGQENSRPLNMLESIFSITSFSGCGERLDGIGYYSFSDTGLL